MSEDYYDFEYLGFESNDSDEYQKGAFLCRFVSQRSHHRYLVRVELYINNLHCIKFYDESDGNFGDFSRITATFEPRRIFRTVANIGFEVFRKNRSASFMYIGAADYRDLRAGQHDDIGFTRLLLMLWILRIGLRFLTMMNNQCQCL